jgi:hypothetical protein
MLDYPEELIDKISTFLQSYMERNNFASLSANECAEILANNSILPNNIGPKPGFNFRQVLRDGREGKNKLVEGAFQSRPKTRWIIKRINLYGS